MKSGGSKDSAGRFQKLFQERKRILGPPRPRLDEVDNYINVKLSSFAAIEVMRVLEHEIRRYEVRGANPKQITVAALNAVRKALTDKRP